MINRREALSRVSLILGGSLIGAEAFLLNGCEKELSATEFSRENIAFLDEVGETIIPTTDTPGAKAAEIGAFMALYVTDCYEPEDQEIFLKGVISLNQEAQSTHQQDFIDLSAEHKTALLTRLDAEAKAVEEELNPGERSHYFTMMKQLTLLGYFTSEIGATQALRYVEVPGRYEGCAPYEAGDKAWAI